MLYYADHPRHLKEMAYALHKKDTILQVTTMLATSKKSLFPGHNHWPLGDNQSVRSLVLVVIRWLWPGSRILLEMASMVVSWWIVAFLCSDVCSKVRFSVYFIHNSLLDFLPGLACLHKSWWTCGSIFLQLFFFVYLSCHVVGQRSVWLLRGRVASGTQDFYFRHESKLPVCRTLGLE